MKKQNLCVLFLAISVGISALDEQVTLGGQDLWGSLSGTRGTRLVTGLEGFPDVVLADSEYGVTETTDLLVHFNTSPPLEETSRYRLLPTDLRVTAEQARFGNGAGIFTAGENGIELAPLPGSLLAPGVITSDFSIEFWMYPALLQEGETVLLWTGSRLRGSELLRQEIRCTVTSRSLVWSFLNFFTPPDGGEFLLTLAPRSGLIPRQWHHHMIRFDSETGLVEYLVDNRTEAVAYATTAGREHPELYLPRVGEFSRGTLAAGPYFTGFLDELRISKASVTDPVLRKYQNASGAGVTKVVDLQYSNTAVTAINAVVTAPGTTAVFFYYRTADVKNGIESIPGEWIPFIPGKPLRETSRGRFLQLRFELYTDGNESRTPAVSRITVQYQPDRPPSPPNRLTAEPRDGSVVLRWSAVPEADIAGYRLYYGTKPGVYFGTAAVEGPSPIDVGNRTSFTLSGLENGRLYYFSIAAYDSAAASHTGEFSREVSARPSRVYQ